MQEEEEENR